MGLWPLFRNSQSTTIQLAGPAPETKLPKDDLIRELGGTGTQIFGGFLSQEDYNSDLNSSKMYDVYDKMRKADGTVRAGLNVAKLPLLRTDWYVEPASDNEQDVQIAADIEENLLCGMTISWHDFLRHALLHLDFGSMPFEKVWEVRDGRIQIRKLAPRMPKTVVKWLVDDTGGFAGITQGMVSNAGYVQVDIPSEKCLVFVNEREGSDYRGTSVLRAAYKHWYMKDRMYIIDAISQEKRGLGVDVGKLSSTVTKGQRQEAERALMTIRSHEKNYLIEPDWLDYRVEGLGRGASRDGLPSIEHHDVQILRSILAEFVAMGQSGGSLAMHRDKSTFFLMALEAIAENICETMNRYLIPQMVAYNYPNIGEFPELHHSRLDTREIGVLADAVSKFVSASALTVDREIEQDIRALLEFPELPDDDDVGEAPAPDADSPAAEESLLSAQHRNLRRFRTRRNARIYANGGRIPPSKRAPGRVAQYSASQRTSRITARFTTGGVRVDFGKLDQLLNDAEDAIMKSMNEVQKRQIQTLLRLASSIIAKGDLQKVGTISVPYKQDLAEAAFSVLSDLYLQGQKEVQTELSSQNPVLVFAEPVDVSSKQDVLTFLRYKAEAMAALFADKLKSAFVWNVLDQAKSGEYNGPALEAAFNSISEREARKIAGGTVGEAFNFGRNTAAEQSANHIKRVEYSALLDSGTCGPCNEADGKTFAYGSAEMDQYKPPYAACEGKGNCRCILVFVTE